MKEQIVVETKNIKVGKNFYSFDFKVWRNGKLIRKGSYDSGHSRAPQTIRRYLNRGGATELVLEHDF